MLIKLAEIPETGFITNLGVLVLDILHCTPHLLFGPKCHNWNLHLLTKLKAEQVNIQSQATKTKTLGSESPPIGDYSLTSSVFKDVIQRLVTAAGVSLVINWYVMPSSLLWCDSTTVKKTSDLGVGEEPSWVSTEVVKGEKLNTESSQSVSSTWHFLCKGNGHWFFVVLRCRSS